MSSTTTHDPERIGRRSRALEALAQLGTIEIDLESAATRASEEAHRLLGVTSLSGLRPLLRHLWPASRRELLEALQVACTRAGTSHCEIDVIGGRRIHCSFGPIAGEEGRTVLAVLRDVSDEHYGALGRARAVSRSMQLAGLGAWAIDVRANRLEWTEEVFRIHDLPNGDTPTVEEAIAFYPPEAAVLVERGLADAIAGRGPYDLELPLVTAKGRHVWVHTHGDVELDDHGVPLRIFGTFQDITVRRAAREHARRNEERLALALEGARDGVWDWDVATGKVHFSSRWKAILGYADHEITDDFAEWESRVPEEDRGRALELVQRSIRGEIEDYRVEFRMRHKDGSWRWILARAQATQRDAQGNALRVVGTHTDITEQVELRTQLILAKESAEAAARAKAEFLATMSHEIRTPMNGLLGLARILLEGDLTDEQRAHVRSMLDSGSALLSVLNDVLDLSKAEAGMLEFEALPFRPLSCARDAVELMRVEAESRGCLALAVHSDEDVPEWIIGDPGRLRQVLVNLVGNAVKFTPEGRVDIRLSVRETEAKSKTLRIAVHDTGIGIEPGARERLFEAFTQADASTTRCYGGTGLGLSISRHLVQRMNGTLDCEANEGGGSVFWLEIPVREGTPGACEGSAAGDALDARYDGGGAPVLVAEDNPVNQVVARCTLERLGFDVSIVSNGLEAVHATDERAFDIVFMDCQMPVMDGYEAMKRIRTRSEQRGAAPPVLIALTAYALEGDRERCIAAGADDYVAKPLVMQELLRALHHAAARRRAA